MPIASKDSQRGTIKGGDRVSNNHNEKEEGRLVKKCPVLKDWCDKEALGNCAFATTLTRQTQVGPQHMTVCGIEAMLLILSEINQKTGQPQQVKKQPEIILPFSGNG